ncbi:translation initiation factor IF-3, putative [Plasmodium gallinaceum]|uniref:Translation initiation factor IF-3, putative n=1 Tax=Plasmodium gallinaceum TaxID=5849 RepID=A0A1J1GXS5_PLAGA|nr:translation initiation factor IF-3, putative [Plasmodium gallinaceum]CRG97362.1 translation initiation factor IF-3, putative [Plasmodium gallinaceum]
MNVFLLNKKLILLPTCNLKILCDICRLFYSYFTNNFFFQDKCFIKNINYSENTDYQRYLYNNILKNCFFFLKKKKNTLNENSKKNVEEKTNDDIRSKNKEDSEIKKDELINCEIDKDEINKVIKNKKIKKYEIINNIKENDTFSSNTENDKYCSFNKKEVLNSTNYKSSIYYNFDPSLKTKRIQIYYNCEMYDMERKIKKIKNLLMNGFPVDILLIYNTDNIINKSSEKQNKKFKQEENEKNKIHETNKITKFVETEKLKQTKYSLHIYIKTNLILNSIKNISVVDQIFRHFKNRNHIILIKVYPK